MKRTILPVILLASLACATIPAKNAASGFEYPLVPGKLLADALVDTCPICVKELRDRAYVILDKAFPPGTRFTHEAFSREPGGKNIFAPGDHREKRLYKKDPTKGDIYFPRVLFRFHTSADHLVGIGKNDYTDASPAKDFSALPPAGLFRGNATVVRFDYGNGKSFTYSPSDNIIYIHCRLDGVSAK